MRVGHEDIHAINQFLEYGESEKGKSQQGYFSGHGWAATQLRDLRDRLQEEQSPSHPLTPSPPQYNPGPRMATYAVIPLSTHRKRLEELAEYAKSAFGPALMSSKKAHFEHFVDAINAELARLLEEGT